eukprot:gb/GEZN01026869.1/.p1 GENE.gb/GEZN01026869.1/~~gb/GEZN01026869.1/.p1  ORF type:complete len:103 (-),score=4.10 gb/GEZN01026869.1/:58-366(-)
MCLVRFAQRATIVKTLFTSPCLYLFVLSHGFFSTFLVENVYQNEFPIHSDEFLNGFYTILGVFSPFLLQVEVVHFRQTDQPQIVLVPRRPFLKKEYVTRTTM